MDDSENGDDAVIVSRADLQAVASGEKDADDVYTKRPRWGRRAALAAIGGTGLLAFLGGRTSAQTTPTGDVGPFVRAYATQMNFVDHGSDPSSPSNGDLWYNSSA